jgi:polar amino acid transport system substrate-binding protein
MDSTISVYCMRLLHVLLLCCFSLLVAHRSFSEALPRTMVFTTVENSTHSNIGESVLLEAYKRLNISIRANYVPAKRALHISNSGEVDGELHRVDGVSAIWQDLIQVPVAINCIKATAFSIDHQFEVNGWESLKPYSVGVRRGVIFSWVGARGLDVTTVNNNQQLFGMLAAGRTDVIVVSLLNGLKTLESGSYKDIMVLTPSIELYPLYHYLHVRHKDLIPELIQVLQDMRAEGVIATKRKTYLLNNHGEEFTHRYLNGYGEDCDL